MSFYWLTSFVHILFLGAMLAPIIEPRLKKMRYVLLFALVGAPLIMLVAIFYGDWRKELALSSLFKDNLRYESVDYDRVEIDRINIVSLHVMQLQDMLQRGYDACVEAYVNLPNRMGGMGGYQWISQIFEYENGFGSFGDMFSFLHRNSWSYNEIDYGRCVAPNPSDQNFFGFYSF